MTNATTILDLAEIDVDAGHNLRSDRRQRQSPDRLRTIVDGEFLGPTTGCISTVRRRRRARSSSSTGWATSVLIAGGGSDFLSFDGGGTDVGKGNGGNDFFDACGHLDSSDQFDGGAGLDTVELTAAETSTGNYTGANALAPDGDDARQFRADGSRRRRQLRHHHRRRDGGERRELRGRCDPSRPNRHAELRRLGRDQRPLRVRHGREFPDRRPPRRRRAERHAGAGWRLLDRTGHLQRDDVGHR